ncbi:methyl-accepting chemotaxis protein [Nitratidesulfovibrio termitidis]|uniref:methyl-accepting chemotaxis protein n=1 Tax=Nitratidesulfovibrio termitidis TaxID=42252 RepID=UPI0004080AE9|nr:methyl-accepting chemotaxis protein [Nitratidesulfovibrio termitidis]
MGWNLRNRFLVPTLGLVLIGMVVSSWLSYSVSEDAQHQAITAQSEMMVRAATGELGRRMQDQREDIASQGMRNVLADVLRVPPGADKAAVVRRANEALRQVVATYNVYQVVNVLGPDGIVAASNLDESVGKENRSNRDYFKRGMQGEATVSEPLMSMTTNTPVVVVATPLKVDGKVAGVVYGSVDLARYAKEFINPIKIGKTGYAFLVSGNGKIIAHPDASLILKTDISELDWGKKVLAQRTGSIAYPWQGITKYAYFMEEPFSKWIMCITVDESDIRDPVAAIRNVSVAATTIILVLVGTVIFLIVRNIVNALGKGVEFASAVAEGDLSRQLDLARSDEIGTLSNALRTMVDRLKDMIATSEQKTREAEEQGAQARRAMAEAETARAEAERAKSEGMQQAAARLEVIVDRVGSASEELAAQIEQASRGADVQRERTGETATAMEEMNSTVMEVARNASSAADNAEKARRQAEDGEGIVRSVVEAIEDVNDKSSLLRSSLHELGDRAESIGQILNVISDIADQTNLLALNAAIEAARAGDAGRGFAVVADEVRKLAEKTMNATKEVGDAVRAIQGSSRENVQGMEEASMSVGRSTELATMAGDSLRVIVDVVQETADRVRAIATAAEEQSAASEEINRGTDEVNRIAAETAEVMEQSSQAVGELARMGQELRQLVEQLKRG